MLRHPPRNRRPAIRACIAAAITCAVALGLAPVATASEKDLLDAGLPAYQRVSGVSGSLSSIGSDTMVNLVTLWAEAFKREYPSVDIQIQGAGSSNAPPALAEGTANIGPMSRMMKDKEIESFTAKHGYKPTAVAVAIDALAVYVHRDNPLPGLSIAQVDAIFSTTRRCGATGDVATWGAAGLEGPWKTRPIQLYGRNSASGTYGYFKEEALCGGDFKNSVNEQPGSAAVVQAITAALNGIGYSGIGYRTSGVRALPLALESEPPHEFVEATAANAVDGSYPLSRFLYVYVNRRPGSPLRPVDAEFLRLALSRAGQEVVLKDGYVPLTAALAARELAKLD
jgi:phosphate transport system substrate-binding protein